MFCISWRKEAATGGGQLKVMFLKISQKLTGKHLCRSLYFNAQVLSCEFCETFKSNFLKNTSVRLPLDRIQM